MHDWKAMAEAHVLDAGTYPGKWEVSFYGPAEKGRLQIIESDYPGHGKFIGVYETMEEAYSIAAEHNVIVKNKMDGML